MDSTATVPDIRWMETRLSRWDDLVTLAADSGMRVTPETAMRTGVWFACARIIAETVASLPLHLYRRLDDHNNERAKDSPLYRVLARRPNAWQTRYEWVEQMCLHLGFHGAAYSLKVPGDRGSVTELHPLHPSGMDRRKSHDDPYVYREPGTGRQVIYRPDQILAIRWLSMDGINGEVPVELGKDAVALARHLEKYASTFYQNNAQPGIILHTDQALPKEVREQLRDQWNSRHAGSSRAGQTAILSNGLKADTISATNQESQLAELWLQALLAVCRVWRMPPHMVQELGRATWGNLASEMVSFEKFTIAPWLRRIEGAIERDILVDEDDLYAEFLVEGLLRSDITTRYQAYEVALRNGWMTVEEVRRRENLGPIATAENDSPGEVEDTPGDMAEDVLEVQAGTSEDAPDDTEDENRYDPNQPRGPDGKWGGDGSGSSGDSGAGPAAGGDSGGSDSSAQEKSTKRKERLRDRIEGTQAEADREVVKADRKVKQIQQKIAAVKEKIAGSALASAKAKVAAAEQSLGQIRARIADLKAQAAASKARMAELKSRLKQRAADDLEAALEQESTTAERILTEMVKANADADKILASLE